MTSLIPRCGLQGMGLLFQVTRWPALVLGPKMTPPPSPPVQENNPVRSPSRCLLLTWTGSTHRPGVWRHCTRWHFCTVNPGSPPPLSAEQHFKLTHFRRPVLTCHSAGPFTDSGLLWGAQSELSAFPKLKWSRRQSLRLRAQFKSGPLPWLARRLGLNFTLPQFARLHQDLLEVVPRMKWDDAPPEHGAGLFTEGSYYEPPSLRCGQGWLVDFPHLQKNRHCEGGPWGF